MSKLVKLVKGLSNGKKLLVLVLIVAILVGAAYAAIRLLQVYTYRVATTAGLSGPTTLDFGPIGPGTIGSQTFLSVLDTGTVNTPITIAFSDPASWSSVFQVVVLHVKLHGSGTDVACISLPGTSSTCTAGATFTPPGTSTDYDYLVTYTVSGLATAGQTLQTTWSG